MRYCESETGRLWGRSRLSIRADEAEGCPRGYFSRTEKCFGPVSRSGPVGLCERGTDATQAAARVRAASGEADGCGRRRHVESVAEREVGSGPFSAAFFGKNGRCVDEAEGRA